MDSISRSNAIKIEKSFKDYKRNRYAAIILFFILLLAAAVWYFFYKSTFIALAFNDSMDYASMGRNIAQGKGFISSYITPLGLAHKGLPHPDLWRAPMWPVMLALFIKLFGGIDQAAAIASGVFYLAAVPMIFLLARYWFGTTVAAGASVIYIFSAQNLQFSVAGLTEPMALFLMVAVVFLLYMPQFRSPIGDLLLGLITGLFYLTRYNALLFLPLILICRLYIRKSERSGRGFADKSVGILLRLCCVFFITVLPWLWRNYVLIGSPLFSLQKYEPVMFTKTYPGYSLYTMLEKIQVLDFMKVHWSEVWFKIGENWHGFVSDLFNPVFTGVSAVLFGLFVVSLFLPFNERQGGFRSFLIGCFGLQLAALLVIHYIPRLFFMFMPFYIIYGLAALAYLFELINIRRTIGVAGITGVTLLFVLTNMPDWREPNISTPLVKDYAASLQRAINLTNKEQLILSNDGHLLAWYGDRYAAKLPYSTDMLPELIKLAPVKMIYLSGRMSWNMPEADDSWRKVFWGKPQELYDFKLQEKFEDGSLIYVKK